LITSYSGIAGDVGSRGVPWHWGLPEPSSPLYILINSGHVCSSELPETCHLKNLLELPASC
jgi:hypothetical protein